jgi:hypothetical protein
MKTIFTAADEARAKFAINAAFAAYNSGNEADPLGAVTRAEVYEIKRSAALRAASINDNDMRFVSNQQYKRGEAAPDESLEVGCALGGIETKLIKYGLQCEFDAEGRPGQLIGFELFKRKDTVVDRRSKRNVNLEYRSRASLREAARHDPAAFRASLPADILDRLLVPDGDDFPNGAPMRHPTLVPTWSDVGFVDDKFMVAPRLRHNVSPGLALGAAEIAAEGDIPNVDIHGVKIGLRRADKKAKAPPRAGAPFPKPSWPGRKYDQHDLMAYCAGRGTVPSFLRGITIAAA